MKQFELKQILQRKQEQADYAELEVNVIKMYMCFYQQHKEKHGTCNTSIGNPDYDKKMDERHNWCIDQVTEATEAKAKFLYNGKGELK